ncbi:MAG TPA: LacI family DNA-binding transcriptional regulator [Capsulimonadaceae bacterium]|jgi:DNA-binding LacI/PurR family transcriptional regulator
MRRGNATTLSDVAREVGVTPMAVSVVLNGTQSQSRVSDATRVRILEVAKRLQYRPNGMARGLVQRKVDTIGIVSPVGTGNLYWHEILDGVLLASSRHRQNTSILPVTGWEENAEAIVDFGDGRIDSVLLVSPLLEPNIVARLTSHIPVATIHPNYEYEGAFNVYSNENDGAYEATKYLISQGHRDIAHFGGPQDWSGGRERMLGYLRAMKEAGLEIRPHRLFHTGFSMMDGRARAYDMIRSCSTTELPTAIFCGSDGVAFGVMQVLAEAGIAVPDQISIIGFDDNMLSQITMPQITTVRQPFEAMAKVAVESLVTEVANQSAKRRSDPVDDAEAATQQTRKIVLPVDLVVRETVRRI